MEVEEGVLKSLIDDESGAHLDDVDIDSPIKRRSLHHHLDLHKTIGSGGFEPYDVANHGLGQEDEVVGVETEVGGLNVHNKRQRFDDEGEEKVQFIDKNGDVKYNVEPVAVSPSGLREVQNRSNLPSPSAQSLHKRVLEHVSDCHDVEGDSSKSASSSSFSSHSHSDFHHKSKFQSTRVENAMTIDAADTPLREKSRVKRSSCKTCKHPGCEKRTYSKGVCTDHGAKKRTCKVPGCEKAPKKGGVCVSHGAKLKRCSVPECVRQSVQGGVCVKHGARQRRCTFPNCTKVAIRASDGLCVKHGGKVRRCKVEGCPKQAQRAGMCIAHGTKQLRCSVSGCSNERVRAQFCRLHGISDLEGSKSEAVSL